MLKLEISCKDSNTIGVQVISQPESIIRGSNEVFTFGGVILLSVASPEISNTLRPGHIMIWLWGISQKHDSQISYCKFNNTASRDEAIRRINLCVDQFNKEHSK